MIKTYAEIDSDNKVINTILASESFIVLLNGIFIECTESTKMGSLGMTYNKEKNKFIHAKPYPSWVLNENSLEWESPIGDKPNDDKRYIWNEEGLEWQEMILLDIDL
jgi:hypothetical protein